jgi:SAM-dependent methyltransferase
VTLALAGMEVEAWDHLPEALERCDDLARRNGVAVTTVCHDVEADTAIPSASFDLVICFNFLHRPLMPALAAAVRPGGFVVYETFVEPQRERFGRPRKESHVLRPGELVGWFEGWEVIVSRGGLVGERRIAASLIAMKP